LIYVTGRPDLLKAMTRRWLKSQGFPLGLIRCTDTLSELRPTEGGVGDFKSRIFQGLKEKAKLDIVAAYGNARSDIYACKKAGFPKATTFIVGKHAGVGGTTAIKSYGHHLPWIKMQPVAKVVAPLIDSGWPF
jgi:phosphatidate phosphatase PAH1